MTPAAPGLAGRDFFERDTVSVARDLLGSELVVDGGAVVARLVEVEAYLGADDAASHAFRGPTARSSIMFQDPGHLYVYLSYGMHHCANLVTERTGIAGAVLMRAASVVEGFDIVRARRQTSSRNVPDAALLRGPGNLCRGLDLTREDNGLDACAPLSRLHVRTGQLHEPVVSTRIGISQNTGAALRFSLAGDPSVSQPRPRG